MSASSSPPFTDDTVLVGLIASGDQAAFNKLMSIYMRPLTIFTTRFLSSRADGEDVAQIVFMEVWRKAEFFDPSKASVKNWLYGIARNRCIDAIRRQRLRQFIGLDGATEDLASMDPGSFQVMADRAELKSVAEAVHVLPDRQRMALLLHAVSGMTTREIAATMATSDGAIEQLIRRARKTLRQTTHRGTTASTPGPQE